MSTKWLEDAKHDGQSFGGDMIRLGAVVALFYLGGHIVGLPKEQALEVAMLTGGVDWFNRPRTYRTVHDVREKFRRNAGGESYERSETDKRN